MKRVLFLIGLVVLGTTTLLQAQTATQDIQTLNKDKDAVKAAKEVAKATKEAEKEAKAAEKEARKATEEAENMLWYNAALKALTEKNFVLEADRIEFKRGRFVYVTPSTNFVSLNGDNASIQLAFNTAAAGLNGLGGITVDGRASGIDMKIDKKGNVIFKMMVQGSAVSATVTIRMQDGGNKATVTVDPNFNSNRISFSGTLYPQSESSVFKGRSLF